MLGPGRSGQTDGRVLAAAPLENDGLRNGLVWLMTDGTLILVHIRRGGDNHLCPR